MAANDRPMGRCCKACNAVVFPARCSTGTDGVGRSDDRASRGDDRAPGWHSVDMAVIDAVVVDAVVVDRGIDDGAGDGAGDGVTVDDSKDGDDGVG